MSDVVVDAALSSQLVKIHETVNLRDPTGRILGQFQPAFDWSQWEAVGPEIDDVELQRRFRANEKTYSLAEVLAHLDVLI